MPPAFDRAWREAAAAELILVVGSSLEVYPAASLADHVPHLVVINLQPTPADGRAEVVIHASAGETLSRLADLLVGPPE